jgi:hypothetical protein
VVPARRRRRVSLAWLTGAGRRGLICLSGAQAGAVGTGFAAGRRRLAPRLHSAMQLAGVFAHRFYLELQRAGRADDDSAWWQLTVQLAHRTGACRRWPRTRFSSPRRRTLKPMRPASALPRAKFWPIRAGCAALPASSTSRPRAQMCRTVRRRAISAIGQQRWRSPDAAIRRSGAGQAAVAGVSDSARSMGW